MKSILDTAQNLMSLGLHGMAAAYERQLETPALLKEPFETRLGLMMDAENSERESRKVGRLLKNARLRENEATIDSIEFKASRGIDRNTVMSLGECEWLARRQNVIITGATGTGKTWLACALGNQACRLGRATLYRTGIFQGSCRVNRLTMPPFSRSVALDPGSTTRCRSVPSYASGLTTAPVCFPWLVRTTHVAGPRPDGPALDAAQPV